MVETGYGSDMDHCDLTSQHVLVIGATGDLGSAIARAATATAETVTVTSRSESSATDLAAGLGDNARPLVYDPTDHGTVGNLRDAGPYDHLVFAAADLTFDSMMDISDDDLRSLVDSKLFGAMWTARHAKSSMNEGGSMLFLSGMLSREPAQAVPLAAVNGAIESLGRGLAREFSPLRVNVISPGGVGTATHGDHDGTPDDVAALSIATLSNPWINGAVLDIHG